MAIERVRLELFMEVGYIGSYKGEEVGFPDIDQVGLYQKKSYQIKSGEINRDVLIMMYVDNATGEVLDSWVD